MLHKGYVCHDWYVLICRYQTGLCFKSKKEQKMLPVCILVIYTHVYFLCIVLLMFDTNTMDLVLHSYLGTSFCRCGMFHQLL